MYTLNLLYTLHLQQVAVSHSSDNVVNLVRSRLCVAVLDACRALLQSISFLTMSTYFGSLMIHSAQRTGLAVMGVNPVTSTGKEKCLLDLAASLLGLSSNSDLTRGEGITAPLSGTVCLSLPFLKLHILYIASLEKTKGIKKNDTKSLRHRQMKDPHSFYWTHPLKNSRGVQTVFFWGLSTCFYLFFSCHAVLLFR